MPSKGVRRCCRGRQLLSYGKGVAEAGGTLVGGDTVARGVAV